MKEFRLRAFALKKITMTAYRCPNADAKDTGKEIFQKKV